MNTRFRKNPNNFANDFTRFLDDIFGDVSINQVNKFYPPVNIIETENDYQLEISAPGWNKEDFNVKIEGDFLNISANKPKVEATENTDEGGEPTPKRKYVKREFNTRSFKRTFTLNEKMNKEEINASYENGILYVTLVKAEEAKPVKKTIEVS